MGAPLAKDLDRFVETQIDDEIVVMSLESGDFFSLEGTAAAIWRLLDGTRDRAAILVDLSETYDGDSDELAADVDAFVDELRAAGLLRAG